MTKKNPRPCPACNCSDFRNLGNKNNFDIVCCRKCGTLFTDRIPDETEAENYDDYYSESNLTVPGFIRERLREIIGGFESYRKCNRLLDIGFGAGTMLEIAKEMGWKVYGLEVSKPAADQARQRGFNVVHGDLAGSGFEEGYFDVVAASEILEHLPNPKSDLREIARILRPGGLFWGTTPNAKALSFSILKLEWSILSPPEHIQLYSSMGVRLMLCNAGFEKLRLKTYGLNPSEIKNHFRPMKDSDSQFSRVNSGYELNESLTRSPFRKAVKSTLNRTLNLFGVGDSLKVSATKPEL
jgi:SAM-dependent methyltransferase